ncbi:regulator of nucleoside diphosphate kinase [Maribacter orientalis]|uniref:Regulator of nucleoside diphosphate kinase n=1 Tax=Maribacter orientalis TaxID=228957 RepID=A0A1H7LF98_9FLAO|nr:GreA/GreB family elongation factor [Maribacter orientalis]SEK97634.1 regulator of nucleoside diphosphate kinase [Maribacter orientalis]|tara:strand:- start:3730 stop:4149 length:420 start_codon:yes stop_codon:yes gene_type:complete
MKHGNLIIEKKEYVLLKRLMNLSGYYKDETLRKSVKKLLGELESAKIVEDAKMPADVVRFNSVITIGSKEGWHKTFQLVLPTESNIKEDKISITTPMGAAVIGYAEGDTIIWEFPNGVKELTIEKINHEKKHINLDMVL